MVEGCWSLKETDCVRCILNHQPITSIKQPTYNTHWQSERIPFVCVCVCVCVLLQVLCLSLTLLQEPWQLFLIQHSLASLSWQQNLCVCVCEISVHLRGAPRIKRHTAVTAAHKLTTSLHREHCHSVATPQHCNGSQLLPHTWRLVVINTPANLNALWPLPVVNKKLIWTTNGNYLHEVGQPGCYLRQRTQRGELHTHVH